MSVVATLLAKIVIILTLLASGLTLFALTDLIDGKSIAKDSYLLIPIFLSLAILIRGITAVILPYIAGIISVILWLLILAILDQRITEGVPLPTLLWEMVVGLVYLPASIRKNRNPPTFQDDLDQAGHDTDTTKIWKDQE